ncbi:hypothetical protein LC048_10950 [Mesobacillus subterraneus]|uniref:hypothetical protein n=1 Tax=Mesobacillus subterraneus TaxID=285983 RepID=UPI00273EA420|nr:hypothetical protein [Mesobacillus subterraneus]WLR57326.1 hypothetical protein LC048_10950 [Mesobacillus subterraneus]
MMDKKRLKIIFDTLLQSSVDGLTKEQKIKYMKKWIRDHEMEKSTTKQAITLPDFIHIESAEKIGELVRRKLAQIISNHLLSPEKVRALQDAKHCKNLFDINYPMLKKVRYDRPLIDQRTVNGYYRYWSKPVIIHNEKYLVCNDWYERNRTKFAAWVESLN